MQTYFYIVRKLEYICVVHVYTNVQIIYLHSKTYKPIVKEWLTPLSRICDLWVVVNLMQFSNFYIIWRFITISTFCHLFLSWVRWTQSISSHHISLRSTLTLSSSLCPGVPSVLPLGYRMVTFWVVFFFWDVTLSSPLKIDWHFEGTCCFHLQGWRLSRTKNSLKATSKETFLCQV